MPQKKKVKVDIKTQAQDSEEHKLNTEQDTTELPEPENTVVEIEEKLEAAENEAKANYERFLRTAAELENVKKRAQKDLEDLRKFANESLIKELLGVVDNLERALEVPAAGENDKQIAAGVTLTLRDLQKVLQKFGVQPIESLGKPFDPSVHQAMMQQEVSDQPANVVIQEMQKGYMIHDRLLRPAMVVVSKAAVESGADSGVE
ncbi:MAG: nucleotide exchange factor GrpE [Deltaproteobacteria bacterium]|jgi:molecular chaperone GrpE